MCQYDGMPFGLAEAPPHFQRLIDKMLGQKRGLKVFGYLDDLIVVTETFDEHLAVLSEVIEALEAANLKINVEKCEFCTDGVRYLGYRMNERALLVDWRTGLSQCWNFRDQRTCGNYGASLVWPPGTAVSFQALLQWWSH